MKSGRFEVPVGQRHMSGKQLNDVLLYARKLAAVQTYRTLGDRDLLERFVDAHDEAAFTVLVERNGSMVHGVCERVLRNAHDAEDACQATFLVLARKAGSIRKKTSLSSWLHGVACRVAADLKRELARRQRREQQATRPEREEAGAEVSWQEVRTVLDEELQLLPERYRSALILCYLDGKTRDEAARKLGIAAGSLRGRLDRGRKLLRQRLTWRGITLSAALLATTLSESAVIAALRPTFVISCTKAALAYSAAQPLAQGVIAPHVLSLTEGVLKAMFLTKLKIGTAMLMCATLLIALLGGSVASRGTAQETDNKGGIRDKAPRAAQAPENDEAFLRRISKDLRGREPSPAEVHFFIASKDADKREKVIDLFIQEREEEKRKLEVQQLKLELQQGEKKALQKHQTMSQEHLRRIGLALHNYHDVYKRFPAAASVSKDGKPLLSWRVHILPFQIKQQELYKEFKLDEPWDSPHNKKLIAKMPDVFRSPASNAPAGKTTYLAPIGASLAAPGSGKTIFGKTPTKMQQVTDGLSNTIMLVEADDDKAVWWTQPEDLPIDPKDPLRGLGNNPEKGFRVLFGDGHARFLPRTIAPATLNALFTRDGGELAPLEALP